MRILMTGVVVLAMAAVGGADTRGAGDFAWAGRVAAGQKIEVWNVNGSITAKPSSGDAGVLGHKKVRKGNPAAVEIKLVEHAGGVTVCAVYVASGGTCTPGRGVRGGQSVDNRDNEISIDFDLAVPSGVEAVLNTVNGKVEARDLDADVTAHTVNGGVDVSTRGVARAKTVNGSVTASMGEADWTGELDMSTVNGSIHVAVPDGTGADVDARTVNGQITSDFPLEISGKRGPRSAKGRIGSGGRELSLSTVNGSIEISRR